MKKKTFMAATIIIALLISLVAEIHVVEEAKANWLLWFVIGTDISIENPQNSTTYGGNIPLTFNATYEATINGATLNITYTIDDLQTITVDPSNLICSSIVGRYNVSQWTVNVPELSSGNHKIEVKIDLPLTINSFPVMGDRSATDYSSFFVDNTKPLISILSPEQEPINEKMNVPLIFTVDKQCSWAGYSLDKQANVTATGNFTLNGLSEGPHTITIYANDTVGNIGKSNTIFFTVNTSTPSPSPSPSPTPLASATPEITLEPSHSASLTLEPRNNINYLPIELGIILVIIIAVAGVLVYFKRKVKSKVA
jgi:hypothetical protein